MRGNSPSRLQFVVSGKFLGLLMIAASLLGGGYYWYTQQLEVQRRFRTPPYFINRSPAVIRLCNHCMDLDKLKPRADWNIGAPSEIPATEQRWFLAVEDPPLPVGVAGVLMLPVHPALGDNPALGFDRTQVLLLLFQSLQRMPDLTQPPPSLAPVQPPPPSPPPADTPAQSPYLGIWKNEDSETRSVTKFSVAVEQGKLAVHAWGKCFPTDCDWKEAEASPTDGGLSVVWSFGFTTRTWKLSPESDDRLKLSEHAHYTDSRTDRDETSFFVRSPEGQQ